MEVPPKWQIGLVVVLSMWFAGCSGNLAPVKAPKIDVDAAVQGALATFDTDSDGAISKEEACAGINAHWDRYDVDEDNAVSAEELASRFSKWTDGDTGLMRVRAFCQYRGQPLPDATITLTPYDFLGENVYLADGETDQDGYAFLAAPNSELPESLKGVVGMQVGLFKVTVTHPSLKLPAKYNTETELSLDISPSEANTGVALKLK